MLGSSGHCILMSSGLKYNIENISVFCTIIHCEGVLCSLVISFFNKDIHSDWEFEVRLCFKVHLSLGALCSVKVHLLEFLIHLRFY